MSDAAHVQGHGHDTHGDHGHDNGHAHGTMGSYMIGFGLSVVLTAIPFWLVMTGALGDAKLTGFTIMAFAVAQIVVHMIFFLHMSTKSEGGWTMMALIFTLVVVGITLSGSMWVMYHLNNNMMPHAEMPGMPGGEPGMRDGMSPARDQNIDRPHMDGHNMNGQPMKGMR